MLPGVLPAPDNAALIQTSGPDGPAQTGNVIDTDETSSMSTKARLLAQGYDA